jgi:hypothetical protein
MIFSSIYWSAQFGGWSMGINISHHRPLEADFGVNLALLTWLLGFTVGVFVILRVLSLAPSFAGLLTKLGGAIAIVAPAACFWLVQHSQPAYFLYVRQWTRWLPIEEVVAVLCVVLFLYRRWPISVWTTVFLLAVHFALWYRAYSLTFTGGRLAFLAIPIAAFLSILAWGFCMRHKTVAIQE